MPDIEKVKEQLAAIRELSEAELLRYAPLIVRAAAMYDTDADGEDGTRAALLAAAKANYWIAMAKADEAKVTSFTAGDIRITETADGVAAAFRLLETLENDSRLTGSSGFVFRTV